MSYLVGPALERPIPLLVAVAAALFALTWERLIKDTCFRSSRGRSPSTRTSSTSWSTTPGT